MYVIIVPIQVKEGHKEEFVKASLLDAQGSVNDEPGCLRFDLIQDPGDSVWLTLNGVVHVVRMRAPRLDLRCHEVFTLATKLSMRSRAFSMFSAELAKEKRTYPFPY